ncbi:D-aminoacyl-tRNA deacylase [Gammaproteobacteria bacterium]|jgi:D-tyrosyl-tRNA(Tyr) deacylase|nr:D-aminoacyl-tRNA deacylase [Gammaproteobacteria bacterium]
MIALIQRVTEASVVIDGSVFSSINKGLLVLIGIELSDSEPSVLQLSKKILNLRVFDDDKGLMNLSVSDIGGEVLVVPNFTLAADTSRGNRPGFSTALKPDLAKPLFDSLYKSIKAQLASTRQGRFGADMQVSLVNDGPITISLKTNNP